MGTAAAMTAVALHRPSVLLLLLLRAAAAAQLAQVARAHSASHFAAALLGTGQTAAQETGTAAAAEVVAVTVLARQSPRALPGEAAALVANVAAAPLDARFPPLTAMLRQQTTASPSVTSPMEMRARPLS
jgi:hypothetical protein